ncbi:NACHT domain-containing protein [Coleofasciculus sp. FACHB-129]|uniref:NACHT domain-containing protein n=1 Tax=Cyanophyceae TaxID=3028117 RepID=UPI001683846A|nr:NACHT domain-containing protein [Coleofasciculus sp. FACHB-129]MBD1895467.1 NACHT domain-containing protein [Coleofasciculus sp. FACHB-129]
MHNAVWLTLGMEQQDYRVQRPWSATVVQPSQSPLPLAAGTRIVEVFDRPELAHQLLILGEPGAGKTTMMLELAEDLLRRAIADKAEPIPVLLSLSSWKNPKQSIFEWLVGELKGKYGIRQDLAQRWLKNNQLLPLLDGLDEVAPQHQEACAVALNAWLTGELDQRPCGVLICCRREEFEQVVRQPLNLYGAIYLQALTVEQIEDYFAQFELQDVWQTVQQDEALQELLTKPLFLSMFGLVQKQGKFSLDHWRSRTTCELKIEYLLDTYWEAAIARELIIDPNEKQRGILSKTYGTKPLPQRLIVQRALVFAAKALDKESQTELLIERMQPSWLLEKQQREFYKLLFMLFFTLVLAGASSLASRVSEWLPLLVSTFPWLSYFLTIDNITPTEKLQFNKKLFYFEKEKYGVLVIVLSIITWIIAGIVLLVARLDEKLSYSMIVLLTGIAVNIFVAWLIKNMRAEIDTQTTANQGIKNSWNNIVFFTLFVLFLYSLIGFVYQLRISSFAHIKFPPQLFFTFIIYLTGLGFLEGGGKALLQHLALRLVLTRKGYAPFRYDLLLNYCTERLLLQRIGGRYRFMHKLLQDHFAKMDLE